MATPKVYSFFFLSMSVEVLLVLLRLFVWSVGLVCLSASVCLPNYGVVYSLTKGELRLTDGEVIREGHWGSGDYVKSRQFGLLFQVGWRATLITSNFVVPWKSLY